MIVIIVLISLVGLFASGIIFKHQRWLTFLAAAGTLAEALWLALSFFDRVVWPQVPNQIVFLGGTILTVLLLLPWRKKWSWPKRGENYLSRELSVALLLAAVLLTAGSISLVNGWQEDAWVTHGFYNGDTMTFSTLVNQSRNLNNLATNNLFAAGQSLEYPTILHGAVASLLDATAAPTEWLHLLPWFTFTQIILTIPLFFLLWDLLTPQPQRSWQFWLGVPGGKHVYWLQAALVFYVLTLSWDGYIYPQSHFFLTNLFLLLFLLKQVSLGQRGWGQIPIIGLILPLAFILSVSNAVTGTAALVMTAVWFVLRTLDKKRSKPERVAWLLALPFLVANFAIFIPGAGSLGFRPNFSYSASSEIIRYSFPLFLLAVGSWWHLKRHFFVISTATGLFFLTGIVFVFSGREIVVANSSRFIYHALLLSLPLLIYPLARAWYWAKREILYTTHTVVEKTVVWLLALTVIGSASLPALQSVASAHDNLMRQDRHVVSADELEALRWLKDNTSSQAIVLASPEAPFTVPQFAGRTMLRATYWLSPPDQIWAQTVQAFAGKTAAQNKVLASADYLFLRHSDEAKWPQEKKLVFSNETIRIYALR